MNIVDDIESPWSAQVMDVPTRLYNAYKGGKVDPEPLPEDVKITIARASKIKRVILKVNNQSELAISWLPAFLYFPQWATHGSGSIGEVTAVNGTVITVKFDATQHETPAMTFRTCFLKAMAPLLIPGLPPGLQQAINTLRLEGTIDIATGEVNLNFESEFVNKIMGKDMGKPLRVNAILTTGKAEGNLFNACGSKLRNSKAILVAVSKVPTGPDAYQNALLSLPTEALSLLRVEMQLLTA